MIIRGDDKSYADRVNDRLVRIYNVVLRDRIKVYLLFGNNKAEALFIEHIIGLSLIGRAEKANTLKIGNIQEDSSVVYVINFKKIIKEVYVFINIITIFSNSYCIILDSNIRKNSIIK